MAISEMFQFGIPTNKQEIRYQLLDNGKISYKKMCIVLQINMLMV